MRGNFVVQRCLNRVLTTVLAISLLFPGAGFPLAPPSSRDSRLKAYQAEFLHWILSHAGVHEHTFSKSVDGEFVLRAEHAFRADWKKRHVRSLLAGGLNIAEARQMAKQFQEQVETQRLESESVCLHPDGKISGWFTNTQDGSGFVMEFHPGRRKWDIWNQPERFVAQVVAQENPALAGTVFTALSQRPPLDVWLALLHSDMKGVGTSSPEGKMSGKIHRKPTVVEHAVGRRKYVFKLLAGSLERFNQAPPNQREILSLHLKDQFRSAGEDPENLKFGNEEGVWGEKRLPFTVEGEPYLLFKTHSGWRILPVVVERGTEAAEPFVIAGQDAGGLWRKAIEAGKIQFLVIHPDGSIAYRPFYEIVPNRGHEPFNMSLVDGKILATSRESSEIPEWDPIHPPIVEVTPNGVFLVNGKEQGQAHAYDAQEKLAGPFRVRLNGHRAGRPAAMAKLPPHGPDCRFCVLHQNGSLPQEKLFDVPVGGGRFWRAHFNFNPFAKDGHLLWIPMKNAMELDAREQRILHQDLVDVITMERGVASQNNVFFFNGLGAAGSVNHIHLQSFYFPDEIPLAAEMAQWHVIGQENGVKMEFEKDYPASGVRFDLGMERDPKDIADVVFAVVDKYQQNNVPINLILRKNKLYVFPRKYEYIEHFPGGKIGACEMMGLIVLTTDSNYQKANEALMRKGLRQVGAETPTVVKLASEGLQDFRQSRLRVAKPVTLEPVKDPIASSP